MVPNTSSNETRSRLIDWLGLERNVVILFTSLFVLGMGEELWVRFVPKYLELLGAGALVIALYGTLKDLLDAVYQYPGGWLADKLGRRASLVIFTLLAIAGYLIYLASPGWPGILVGTLFVMAWSSLTLPAIFAIIGDNLRQERRAIGFGVQSTLKRIPVLVAPPLGGLLIASFGLARGVKAGLVVTVLLALVATFIIRRYYVDVVPPSMDRVRFGDIWRGMDRHLKRLLFADCLARWAEGIPKVFVVLYVTNVLGMGAFQFGGLTSIQMAAAILSYIPLAKLSDRMNRKPFVLLTFVFFAVFPLSLVLSGSFSGVVLAFVIAGLREIGEPARKALIVDLAAEGTRARAVGLYYLVRGLVVFPASLVGGWLWTIHQALPFYIAFLAGAAGLLVYAAWGPGDRERNPRAETPSC